MPLFDWTTKYSVGNISVDKEHQKLVRLINDLYDAMKEARGREVVGRILLETITYTEEHFRNEEMLMEKAGYPELQKHKIEHKKLTEQVNAFYKSYKENNTSVTIELLQFLKNWLMTHIEVVDMKYKGVI
jgi:hemerythrin